LSIPLIITAWCVNRVMMLDMKENFKNLLSKTKEDQQEVLKWRAYLWSNKLTNIDFRLSGKTLKNFHIISIFVQKVLMTIREDTDK